MRNVVVDAWVDLVDFFCVRCDHSWTDRYDLLQARGPAGVVREYFSADGVALPCPYRPDTAPPCPCCGWRVVGRMVLRRACEGYGELLRERGGAAATAPSREAPSD